MSAAPPFGTLACVKAQLQLVNPTIRISSTIAEQCLHLQRSVSCLTQQYIPAAPRNSHVFAYFAAESGTRSRLVDLRLGVVLPSSLVL